MNKVRKCPNCKSKKGFSYNYSISGYGSEKRDFKGNVIDAYRDTVDEIDEHTIFCRRKRMVYVQGYVLTEPEGTLNEMILEVLECFNLLKPN